jgi:GR25 family glycosyltransferase involved in LPS biosynthesis
MEKMQKRFDHFGIEFKRITALDAKMMSDSEYSNRRLFKKMSKGALACAIGHEKIYKDALKNKYERILIFEDDARFVSNFAQKIQEIERLDWDFVLLGSSQFGGISQIKNGFYHANSSSYCTFAYAISMKCYQTMLEWIEKEGYDVADHITIRYFRENKQKCFVFFPNICTMEVEDADLHPNKCQKTYDKRVKWNQIKEELI